MEIQTLMKRRRAAAVFSDEEVRQIRAALSSGQTRKELARLYGVGVETIAKLARGDTYGWVDGSVQGEVGQQAPFMTEEEKAESMRKLQELLGG